MRIIKQLVQDIETNVCEAEEKIETAYKMKSTYPAIAAWYRDMAIAHLNFNSRGHELVTAEIQSYKNSQTYADHPEYADGMMAIWNDKHNDIIAKTAMVKAMTDTFK